MAKCSRVFAGVDHSFVLLNEVTPKQSDTGRVGIHDESDLFAHLNESVETSLGAKSQDLFGLVPERNPSQINQTQEQEEKKYTPDIERVPSMDNHRSATRIYSVQEEDDDKSLLNDSQDLPLPDVPAGLSPDRLYTITEDRRTNEGML